MWIQTGVRVRKRLSWVLTSVTLTFDLWPLPFAWTSLLTMVITPENFMMIQWWEHGEKGVTDRQTDRRTDGQTDGLNQSYSCLVAAKKHIFIYKQIYISLLLVKLVCYEKYVSWIYAKCYNSLQNYMSLKCSITILPCTIMKIDTKKMCFIKIIFLGCVSDRVLSSYSVISFRYQVSWALFPSTMHSL